MRFSLGPLVSARGFTLPEMIVVVAVMGILASIAYVSYTDAKAQSRDKLRQTQLEQMKVALESYKDKYGRYPEVGCRPSVSHVPGAQPIWAGPGPVSPGSWAVECADYIVGHASGINFVPDFIDELPRDPSFENETNRGYYYSVDSDGLAYKLQTANAVETEVLGYGHPYGRCYIQCAVGAYPGTNQTNRCTVGGSAYDEHSYFIYSAGAECR
jgi:prepilin-type N-terminal cleavage/methylation domain-containing protein